MTAAQKLAAYCLSLSWEDMGQPVRERASELILDLCGATLGGRKADSSLPLALLAQAEPIGPASILGTHLSVRPEVAALINGTTAHATELDDVTRESSLHPGVVVLPATIAVAEAQGSRFDDAVTAMVAGYEVTLRVGNALGGAAAYRRGFHPTSVAGVFGSAVAAGLLLGLDEDRLVNALGIAGTFAAGSLEYVSDGTWTKRLNAGWAAHAGVRAAQLAAVGFTGPASVLEGPHGALQSFSDAPAADRLLVGLGGQPLIMTVAVKPYACCRYSHGIIDAVLAIRRREDVRPDDVRQLRLGVLTAGALLVAEPIARKRRPSSVVDAQFSAPYAAAVALLHGAAGLREFSPVVMNDSQIFSLMERTECFTSDELDAAYPLRWPAAVEIHMNDGRVLRQVTDYALGEPENWVSRPGLIAKFKDLASWHAGHDAFMSRLLAARAESLIKWVTEPLRAEAPGTS